MEISNPDKIIFPEPGYTKRDMVEYYDRVAGRMLPWLEGRPLTLERYPNGVDASGFMQKNASKHFSERVDRVEVPKSDGTVTHPVVRDREGLLELANQGTVTFHVWTARTPDLFRPTHLVLDLDPEPGATDAARLVADTTRTTMAEFGLDPSLMVSGKKGFHLWAPIAGLDYDTAGSAARALAGLVSVRLPDVATVEFRKRERHGRVFVDWLRNRWAQSIVSPWSLRPTPRATVATPISWPELAGAEPDGWDLRTAPDRPEPASPAEARPDADAIVTAAREAGVDLDSEFDRFGRG